MTDQSKNKEINKAYKRLANSIVIMAIKDYIIALNDNKHKNIKELEDFFKSDWCNKLSCVKGETIISKLKTCSVKERIEINDLLSC